MDRKANIIIINSTLAILIKGMISITFPSSWYLPDIIKCVVQVLRGLAIKIEIHNTSMNIQRP